MSWLESAEGIIAVATGGAAVVGAIGAGFWKVLGRVRTVLSLLHEISPRLQECTARLHMFEFRMRMLFNHAPIPHLEFCDEASCMSANRAACDLFGSEEKDLLYNGWLLGLGEDRGSIYAEWAECREGRIPFEKLVRIRNQRTHVIETRTLRIEAAYTRDGNVIGFEGMLLIPPN